MRPSTPATGLVRLPNERADYLVVSGLDPRLRRHTAPASKVLVSEGGSWLCILSNERSSRRGAELGPHCSFCGTSTGPFSQVEGLFPVLMCASCQAVRHEGPAELLAHHDPGEPWLKWTCPIEGCGHRALGPWDLEGHAAAEHPGWVATHELLQPYPNQRMRVVYRRVEQPPTS